MRKSLFAGVLGLAAIGIAACDGTTDPIGDPVDLSYAPCLGAFDTPSWFAVQDGDGSWQRITPTGGAFNFTFSSGRGAIATYHPVDGVAPEGLFIVYATTEELQANMPSCEGSVRAVGGTVTGYVTADALDLAMGVSTDRVIGAQSPAPSTFAIGNVDADVSDMVGVRFRTASSASTFEIFPTSVFLRRGITGTTTGTVDFNSTTEAGAPLQRTVTVTNLLIGEEMSVLSNIALSTTMANIAFLEAAATAAAGNASVPFYGVAPTRLNTGESQMLLVATRRVPTQTTEESRYATSVFSDPADHSITLGPTLGAVTVSGGSRPSATYTVQAAYDNLFDVSFGQGQGSAYRQIEILATQSYFGGSQGTVTLTVPNMVGVSGFSSSWLMAPGVSGLWTFLATDADLSILNDKPLTYRMADRSNVFTP